MQLQRIVLPIVIAVAALMAVVSIASSALTSTIDRKVADERVLTQTTVMTQTQIFLPLVANRYPLPPSVFGVQTYWPLDDNNGLSDMKAMGTQWVRVLLLWSDVELTQTTPAQFDWSSWDRAASNTISTGLTIVGEIQGNPSWAAQYPGGPVYSGHMTDLLQFLSAAAERYDGDGYMDAPSHPVIQYWELYNEPDNASTWLAEMGYGYWGDVGAQYADLYRNAYSVMKAANPSIKLLNGGIAYERFREDDPDNPYVRRFIDDFLAAGGGNYVDIFNFHYYPNFADIWAPYGQEVIGKAAFFRSKLASYGLNLPVACTEIGQHSDVGRGGTFETQSRYVVKTFVWTAAAGLQFANWFALRDVDSYYQYGLLDSSWQRKPSFYAFSTAAQQLSQAAFQRVLTTSELGYTQTEGYAFRDGGQDIDVVWMNDEVTRTVRFKGSLASRVDKYGAQTDVHDGDDGVVDDWITIEIGPSPVYVRVLQ